jgi:hypothetical protein
MSTYSNPNFDPAFRRQSAPLFNPLPPVNTQAPTAQNNPYGGLLDYKWEAPTLNFGGGSTTSGSGSGVGAASGASTAASKPNITPGTTPGQTPDTTKQQKPETVSVAEIGNANTIAGLIDLAAKVDRMGDGMTRRHLQTMISDKINEIRRSEKWDADRAHETKTRTHWANVKQKQAAAANPKKDLGWDGDGTATPNTQLTPSTPAPPPPPNLVDVVSSKEFLDLARSVAPQSPQSKPPTIVPKLARMGTNVVTGDVQAIKTPEDAIIAAAARRIGDKYRRQPTSYFPPAEANAPAAAPAPAPAAPTRQMGPTTADLYPQGMPGNTPSMAERFGNTSVGQAVGATGSFLGNAFDTADNAKLAVDRAIGNTVGPVVEGIGRGIGSAGSYLYDLAGQGADYLGRGLESGLNAIDSGINAGLGAVGSAFEAADNTKLAADRAVGNTIASGVDALTSAKDTIQLKTGQALQGLLDELISGRITMEQFNKLRNMLPDMPPPRMPRAPF